MMMPSYIWAKICKKIRGSAIIESNIHHTSIYEAGCNILNSSFGRYSFCGYDCTIVNCDIGSFCSIASNVAIGYAEHPMHWVGTSSVFYLGRDSIATKFSDHYHDKNKRTSIGNDVWIGERVLIKAGVSIADGAVIGMGSVVTKDVERYTIVAGNPARILRKRFDDATIEDLSKIKWWNFSESELRKYARFFPLPQKFLEEVHKI